MADQRSDQALAADKGSVAGGWLKNQEATIVPPWIKRVQQATSALERGPRTRRMESSQLMTFYDSIVAAVQTGDTANLDVAVQALITDRLGQGYGLIDFLEIANQLKTAIWQAAQDTLQSAEAIGVLAALEPIFAHSVTRLAWLSSRAAEAQLQEELERARHTLARLDHTKSDFISIAAHELKTPLTLVQGYTALLAADLKGQPDFQDALTGLNRGTKRLHTIIGDMLDVSLIDSNVLTLSLQPASLFEMVRLVVHDMEKEASGRQIIIDTESFPDQVNVMYLDTRRMYQVFTNLIGNAIKYTPDGGRVTIVARVIQDQGLKFAQVKIADTGIGIASEDLPHIFDKFYRVGETELHSTSKTDFKGGGSGLGLTIVKGLVEAHGGRVWAESPGCDEERCPGSTFYVMMPIYTEPPDRPSERLLGLE